MENKNFGNIFGTTRDQEKFTINLVVNDQRIPCQSGLYNNS